MNADPRGCVYLRWPIRRVSKLLGLHAPEGILTCDMDVFTGMTKLQLHPASGAELR